MAPSTRLRCIVEIGHLTSSVEEGGASLKGAPAQNQTCSHSQSLTGQSSAKRSRTSAYLPMASTFTAGANFEVKPAKNQSPVRFAPKLRQKSAFREAAIWAAPLAWDGPWPWWMANVEEPEQVSKTTSLLVGVLVVMLWEVLCTSLAKEKPTIVTELVALLCRGRKEKELRNQRQGLAHVLCQKMDEFSQENAKAHFWSARTWSRDFEPSEELSTWELEDSSCGPSRFLPLPGMSVIFFAEHTITKRQSEGSIDITLLRVGDLSNEVAVELATIVGTAKAEHCFKASKGLAVFPPGLSSATFSVELRPHEGFISQRFFVVHVPERELWSCLYSVTAQ
ncbi:unnamed protein product [Symbiodinium sp. KB8]|nr:unnamed protein product [Symbiodinium sp. KB8]